MKRCIGTIADREVLLRFPIKGDVTGYRVSEDALDFDSDMEIITFQKYQIPPRVIWRRVYEDSEKTTMLAGLKDPRGEDV